VNLNAPHFNRFVPMQALTGTSDWRNIEFEATTAEEWPEGRRLYVRLKIANCTGDGAVRRGEADRGDGRVACKKGACP
jgi:hypothetical protein